MCLPYLPWPDTCRRHSSSAAYIQLRASSHGTKLAINVSCCGASISSACLCCGGAQFIKLSAISFSEFPCNDLRTNMAATLARFVTSQLKPAITVFQKCRHLHPSSAIIRRSFAGSSTLFDDKKYSTDHEWVMLQDDQTGRIGITDFAQGQLGDVVFIELPEVGATYERAEPFGTVESVKAASDVNAPVSGEVVEVNTALEGEPGLVNVSPYDDGWLVRMKLSDISELDDLMTKEQYEKYIEEAES